MKVDLLLIDRINSGTFIYVKTLRQTSLKHIRTCKQSERDGVGRCQAVSAVRNEKDLKRAIIKIAYHTDTEEAVLDNTFVLDVLVTAKKMNKTEKAAHLKELEGGAAVDDDDDTKDANASSKRDIRPFTVQVHTVVADHETTVAIGILGPVQKVIEPNTSKET